VPADNDRVTRYRKTVAGVLVLAAALAAAAVASSWRGGTKTPQATGAGGSVVRAVERDFQITVSPSRASAGSVLFQVDNEGPDAHELIVVRDNGRLPIRPDGMTVDEESLTKQTVGVLEPGPTGDKRTLRVLLAPGRYVLLCNMYGHYMAGMHAVVHVS
jgi:uncharacterized cupredoxin-like copper-binding protein